jgi:hypothetical protein
MSGFVQTDLIHLSNTTKNPRGAGQENESMATAESAQGILQNKIAPTRYP